jgi:putative transposase
MNIVWHVASARADDHFCFIMNENKTNHRKKLKHYNISYHAHELTFTCYHRYAYLTDSVLCDIFIEELINAKEKFNFKLWAYVLMPNHVHFLLYPKNESYEISVILQNIKGASSTRYRQWIMEHAPEKVSNFLVRTTGKRIFRIWQAGGGFDRNLWNAKAIHYSIHYIEGNPIRAGLTESPEEWIWSSAWARLNKSGWVSDFNDVPVLTKQ